ncbi:MlaA family lipoprotein [Pararhodospirillum photometricum]|nr:VacJ family lipoprotein [Pararhodospirillum photometricum]
MTQVNRKKSGFWGQVARAGILAVAVSSTASCASAPQGDELVSDPMEPWNRYVFAVNDLIYTFLRPWIAPYMVLPDKGKEAVDNVVHNVKTPVILLNDLLQGEATRAWVTTQRFFINTTLGVLGTMDVAAKDYQLPKHREDFGQTLGAWGMGDGPYMVLPLLGPSNPRDALGSGIDMVSHPLFWVPGGDIGTMVSGGRTYATLASEYGGHVNEMDELRKTSLDYYATMRSLYTQMRRSEVKNIEGSKGQTAPVDYYSEGAPAK